MNRSQPGRIVGKAGAGLQDGNNSWAANQDVARIGRGGEVRTESVLNSVARKAGGPGVIHDVSIPGSKANIDHIVVSGSTVYLIDTKVWKPATYWTLFGVTRRGLQRFEFADKALGTLRTAHDRIANKFSSGLYRKPVKFVHVIVVWPSSTSQPINLRFYGRGCLTMTGDDFTKWSQRKFVGKSFNNDLVNALITATR